ncbi:M48 family metallopeptidase [Hymenobacter aerophilus]|uniref:M48 family metallopeptidase n=1 Tax=Hymenobacter aerophilus TaxID=119644 RepID=UPI0003604EDF|nr:M48 family metallopeptidase [Hymenobacter aerophilus]
MRKQLPVLLLASGLLLGTGLSAQAQIKLNTKTIGAGLKAAKAATVSDAEVIEHTKEFVKWSDENNPVAPASSPYAQRLKKIVAGLDSYDGMSMNYKVYLVKDINAFACADGSVRVFAGLMDLMSDEEILGVIGHEIGHVKHKDSKDAMRTALMASALKEGASSQGGAAGALSDSQLGDLGQAIANASFSRAQESSADAYGYDLLKAKKVNPFYMASAFGKLNDLSGGAKASKGAQLFSSHPDSEKRMTIVMEKAKKDGFTQPTK